MRLTALLLCLALLVVGEQQAYAAGGSSAQFDAVRLEVMRVATEMSPTVAHDATYQQVGSDLASLGQHIKDLKPGQHGEPVVAVFGRCLASLTDAYSLWTYARGHRDPETTGEGEDSFLTATLPHTDPLFATLVQRYRNDAGSPFSHPDDDALISSAMISLTVSAKSDADYLSNKIAAVKMQGAQVLNLRYPFTSKDAKDAILVGSSSNEADLEGDDTEWAVRSDRTIDSSGDGPTAIIQTPFFKVAVATAKRKARYEPIPTAASVLGLGPWNTLTADIYIESRSLGAYEDSACVIKQGGSVIRATARSISHPTVTSEARYAYAIMCDFPLAKVNVHRPFAVTLANIVIIGNGEDGTVSQGEIHFNVNPQQIR